MSISNQTDFKMHDVTLGGFILRPSSRIMNDNRLSIDK